MRRDRLRGIYVIDHEVVPSRAQLGLIFYVRATNFFYTVVVRPNGDIAFEQISTQLATFAQPAAQPALEGAP